MDVNKYRKGENNTKIKTNDTQTSTINYSVLCIAFGHNDTFLRSLFIIYVLGTYCLFKHSSIIIMNLWWEQKQKSRKYKNIIRRKWAIKRSEKWWKYILSAPDKMQVNRLHVAYSSSDISSLNLLSLTYSTNKYPQHYNRTTDNLLIVMVLMVFYSQSSCLQLSKHACKNLLGQKYICFVYFRFRYKNNCAARTNMRTVR